MPQEMSIAYECVILILFGLKYFGNVSKLRTMSWEGSPGLSECTLCNDRILVRRRQEGQR